MSAIKSEADRLNVGGLTAKRASGTKVWVHDIGFAPEDHDLKHPRANDDPGDDLVQSIVKDGFWEIEPLVVFEVVGPDGKKALYAVDCSRRRNAGIKAEVILNEAGKLSKTGGKLYAPIVIFEGTIEQALAARVSANSKPLKKPDSCSVLCEMFQSLARFGWTPVELAKEHGHITVEQVGALLRFNTLPAATRFAFDEGILSIPAVIDFLDKIPADKHMDAINAAREAGGFAKPRVARKAARKAGGVKKDQVKVIGAKARTRLVEMLSSNKEELDAGTLSFVDHVLAYEAYLNGDDTALDSYPAFEQLAKEAVVAPKAGRPKDEAKAAAKAKAKEDAKAARALKKAAKLADKEKAKAEKKAAKLAKAPKAEKPAKAAKVAKASKTAKTEKPAKAPKVEGRKPGRPKGSGKKAVAETTVAA